MTPPSDEAGWAEPAVMAALMSAGAERERLEARVQALEDEVRRLKSALSAVLRATSDGLATDPSEASAPDRDG